MKKTRNAATAAAIAAAAAGAFFSPSAGAEILSSKRGFADTGANYGNLQATGAGWYYTWGTGVGNPGNFDANHYPMFWSAPSQTTINSVKTRNPQYVLGFNEPERPDQANMSVAQAISSWTNISNNFTGTNTKLVSPAVADTGGTGGGQAWLRDFMGRAAANNLKVDAVAFHWYGVSNPSNPSGAASSFLSRVDSYWNEYRKPVFITEFAIHDWGGAYSDEAITEANRQFLNIVIPALESRSHVAGYSWYHWFSDARLYEGSPPKPTPMGYDYVGSIEAGELEDVGGKDLGEHAAYLSGGELTMTGATPGTVRYINALANASNISGSIDWSLTGASSWVRIQPGATLRKTGSNRITFGARTVTNNGVLEIAGGALRLGVPMDGTGSINLPSNGGAVGSAARLELTGHISLANPITLAQRNDPAGSDGIRNVSGNNTLSGPVTIAVGGNQARIQSDTGQLTLSGGITTNAPSARNLYFQGAGTGLVSGAIANNASNAAGSINVVKEGAGTWTLTGANTYTGATTVNAGTLRVNRLHQTSAVALNGGTLQVMDSSPTLPLHPAGNNASVSRPSALAIANDGAPLGTRAYNGRLDLGNNDLILDYSAASPLAEIADMLRAGYNGGNWLGNGIASGTASANPNFALAVADNAQLTIPFGNGTSGPLFSGQSVDATTILVKFTHRIDLDLDGVVTTNDATIFNSNYSEGAPAYWSIGDLDYDRVFTSNDATLFNSFYNESLASVPEPASLGVLAAGAALAMRSRRQRAHAGETPAPPRGD